MTAKDRLLIKLEEFRAYLGELNGACQIGWEDYAVDVLRKRGIERTLQLAVEAAIDLGNILISMNEWRAPAANRDVFRILVEQGILDGDLGQAMERMAGFRNILVHDYAKLDEAVVYGILHGQLDCLARFAAAIGSRLAAKDG